MELNTTSEQKKEYNLELLVGLILAFFAAITAICDLGAGKYGDDEMIANQKQTEAYNWYQSKSIKQTLAEGQKNLMNSMLTTNAINELQKPAIDSFVIKLETEIQKYKKEKAEILKGSKAVGKDNWAQDVDGKLGLIKGADQWKIEAEVYGNAGDIFDKATLFLQLSLVFGAVALVLHIPKSKYLFFALMILMGSVGAFFTFKAFMLVLI